MSTRRLEDAARLLGAFALGCLALIATAATVLALVSIAEVIV